MIDAADAVVVPVHDVAASVGAKAMSSGQYREDAAGTRPCAVEGRLAGTGEGADGAWPVTGRDRL